MEFKEQMAQLQTRFNLSWDSMSKDEIAEFTNKLFDIMDSREIGHEASFDLMHDLYIRK